MLSIKLCYIGGQVTGMCRGITDLEREELDSRAFWVIDLLSRLLQSFAFHIQKRKTLGVLLLLQCEFHM